MHCIFVICCMLLAICLYVYCNYCLPSAYGCMSLFARCIFYCLLLFATCIFIVFIACFMYIYCILLFAICRFFVFIVCLCILVAYYCSLLYQKVDVKAAYRNINYPDNCFLLDMKLRDYFHVYRDLLFMVCGQLPLFPVLLCKLLSGS